LPNFAVIVSSTEKVWCISNAFLYFYRRCQFCCPATSCQNSLIVSVFTPSQNRLMLLLHKLKPTVPGRLPPSSPPAAQAAARESSSHPPTEQCAAQWPPMPPSGEPRSAPPAAAGQPSSCPRYRAARRCAARRRPCASATTCGTRCTARRRITPSRSSTSTPTPSTRKSCPTCASPSGARPAVLRSVMRVSLRCPPGAEGTRSLHGSVEDLVPGNLNHRKGILGAPAPSSVTLALRSS
jgi:hypothetical protein